MNNIKKSNEKVAKNVELRILIIGEPNIGKKSIAKRFKILNCTETKQTLFSIVNLDEENTEKQTKNYFYSSYNSMDEGSEEIDIQTEKREEQRLNLMKFSIFYKIDLNSIEITFYPCAEAEPLPLDYIPQDDNESHIFEAKNKISLNKLKKEIAQIIMRPLSHHKNHLEILFLFCFDLSNKNTFNQIKVYHSQLYNQFNLKNNYHKILIGNKLDKKNINNEYQNRINDFLKETSMKYFEISTFMFFNFENFFEKVFYQIFGSFENFSKNSFKKNFHNILEQKSTFLQSERKIYQINLNPSPNAYKNNKYEYPIKKKELIKLFKEKEKYNKNIFINKKGPVFPPLQKKNIFKDNLSELSFENKKDNEKENINRTKSNIFSNELNILGNEPIIWDTEKQKEIKDILTPNSRKKGITLGICVNNSLGLSKNRREKKIKINLKLSSSINNGFSLNIKKKRDLKRALSQEIFENKRKEYYKQKLEEIKKMEEDKNKRHIKNNKSNNEIINKKNKIYLEKEKKYLNKYIKRQKEKLNKQKKARRLNILKSFSKNALIHKSDFYAPTSSLSTNKGFSFGKKLPIKIKVDSPDYPNLLDDFEKIIYKNSKNLYIIKGAERFPKNKSDMDEISDSKLLDKRYQKFESKRKKFIKNKFVDFFKDRKNKKILVNKNRINLKKEDEEAFNEQILKQYKTKKDYYDREINYNLVENSSPKYTLKGKTNYLTSQSYNNNSYDIFNPYEEDDDEDDFYTKKRNKYKKDDILFETPDYSKVKPRYPVFSFGSSERFKTFNASNDKNMKKMDGTMNENDLFKNGVFGYQDYKSFLKTQTIMGTEKKFRCYKDNGVPGPGNYKIMNFAEEISKKGEIVSRIRQKLHDKKKNKNEDNYENNKISIKINE